MSHSFIPDSKVANILGNGLPPYPTADFQAWEDEDKNRFMYEYVSRMSETDIGEVITESHGCDPHIIALTFADGLAFKAQFSEEIYLYLEPHISEQIERARKQMAIDRIEDFKAGLVGAHYG